MNIFKRVKQIKSSLFYLEAISRKKNYHTACSGTVLQNLTLLLFQSLSHVQFFGTQGTGCSPSGSFVRGTPQVRILEWVAISFSRGSSRHRDWTRVSCISCPGRWLICHWATREAHNIIRDGKYTCWFKDNTLFFSSNFLLSLWPTWQRVLIVTPDSKH